MPAYKSAASRLDIALERDDTTGCLNFTGSTDRQGYGKLNGGKDFPGETLAHRIAYRLRFGVVPHGLEIDHLCRNRACCNPDHMEAVTHAVNVSRTVHGANHRNSRKTHCHAGHEYSEENTLWETYPNRRQRKCRTCRKAREKKRSEARRAAKHMLAEHKIAITIVESPNA